MRTIVKIPTDEITRVDIKNATTSDIKLRSEKLHEELNEALGGSVITSKLGSMKDLKDYIYRFSNSHTDAAKRQKAIDDLVTYTSKL